MDWADGQHCQPGHSHDRQFGMASPWAPPDSVRRHETVSRQRALSPGPSNGCALEHGKKLIRLALVSVR